MFREPLRLAPDLVDGSVVLLDGLRKDTKPFAPAWKGQPPASEFGS
jgi:hypothetical protein